MKSVISCLPANDIRRMKEQAGVQKLLGTKKTAEELTLEEYQKQLELAIENH